ncbi:hypothetical protein HDU77_000717 [Chytriomyces hyalinus]|nr:hypothetical protein HDU77_000717 [Chytriomyces hyalinus]
MNFNDSYVTGPLPSVLGNLVNLKNLNLSLTQVNGTISDSFGNLVNLEMQNMSHARLDGSVPASLGNLVNLVELDLQDNTLLGTLPDAHRPSHTVIGELSIKHIYEIALIKVADAGNEDSTTSRVLAQARGMGINVVRGEVVE